ncbi:DUF547 domain-containing protein [Dongia mobilis]|uniref:DUF547 domain-containing protein n=1 Tax=Dongia mobilis TaxID=578943 RepID=UPI00105CF7B6|nr:DUF547 domain-containing protein [Dongia mobilis]
MQVRHQIEHQIISRRGILGGVLAAAAAVVQPRAVPASELDAFLPRGQGKIDHHAFDVLLQRFVKPDHARYNRVDYRAFGENDRKELKGYIDALAAIDPAGLSRNEAYAYWINLYNAKTLDIVLEHYPVASIREIDLGGGFFADGPWSKNVLRINGIDLSLDDIEHRIVRAQFKDPMSHYGLNCASYSCPNLAQAAYTGISIDTALARTATDYINHRRAIDIRGRDIVASKLYSWYAEDFGGEAELKTHWQSYASPSRAAALEDADIRSYRYDWALNDV